MLKELNVSGVIFVSLSGLMRRAGSVFVLLVGFWLAFDDMV
jgi:hypothetical protein